MAAADKFAFSRFSEQRSYKSSDTSGYDEYVEGVEAEETVSLHTPIGKDNIGFRLIKKMGWNGTGLGKNEQGRVEPVPFEMKDDNMGLGRWQMELELAQDATEKRRQLEIEKEITPDLIEKYKARVEKEQRIADATADLRSTYYCEPCDKQYRTYSEFDNHLNSYDHHHRQRLKELYQLELSRKFGGQRNVQEEKEKKLAAKQVAVERATMLAKRAKVGASPGFKPIGRDNTSMSAENPCGEEISGGLAQTSQDGGSRSEDEEEEGRAKLAEKKAKLSKFGLKFQSAGVLSSVPDKVHVSTPQVPSKMLAADLSKQEYIDMFEESMSDHPDSLYNVQGLGFLKEKQSERKNVVERFLPSLATSIDPVTSKAQSVVPSLQTYPAPPLLSRAQQMDAPLVQPKAQTTGPPPLMRKGHKLAQSFQMESAKNDEEEEEEDGGLVKARLPVNKGLSKIKFSIKK